MQTSVESRKKLFEIAQDDGIHPVKIGDRYYLEFMFDRFQGLLREWYEEYEKYDDDDDEKSLAFHQWMSNYKEGKYRRYIVTKKGEASQIFDNIDDVVKVFMEVHDDFKEEDIEELRQFCEKAYEGDSFFTPKVCMDCSWKKD